MKIAIPSHFRSARSLVAAAIIAATSAAIVSAPSTAPRAVAQNAPAKTVSSRSGDIHLSNPKGTAVSDQKNGIHRLKRDVRVTQDGEDFVLYCDDLTFYEKENIAVATINPRVESRDSTIIGDKITADFDEKRIVITGNVTIKSHGSKDGIQSSTTGRSLRGEVLHKASSMTCTRIDYNYETRQAVMSGNVRMRQGDNFGTCDQIRFDETRNIAKLKGKVKFTNPKTNQTFNTPDLTLWIDEDKIATARTGITIGRQPASGPPKPRQTPEPFESAFTLSEDILRQNGIKPGPAPAPPADDPNDIIDAPASVESAPDAAPDVAATPVSQR